MLHLAKVGQQLPRELLEHLKAVLDRGVIEEAEVTRQHARDLRVEFVPLLLQVGGPFERIRLGAGEGALGEGLQPGDGLQAASSSSWSLIAMWSS